MTYSNENARETKFANQYNSVKKSPQNLLSKHVLERHSCNQPDSSFIFHSLLVYGFNIKYLQVQAEPRHLTEFK